MEISTIGVGAFDRSNLISERKEEFFDLLTVREERAGGSTI